MNKRVLHVIDSFDQQAGSAACLLHDLLAELDACGVGSSVVTMRGEGFHPPALPPHLELTVIEAESGSAGNLHLRGLLSKLTGETDLVHLHGPANRLNRAAARAARREGVPYVLSPQMMLVPNPFEKTAPWRRLTSWFHTQRIVRRAACLHAASQVEADLLRRWGPETRVEVIAPSVDPRRYAQACETDGLLQDVPQLADHRCLLFLGRIHPIEGLAPLLIACEVLVDTLEGWHLVLAGPAPQPWPEQIEAAVRRRGESRRVTVLPSPDGERQRSLLARADLLIQPCLCPQIPTAALQAMASAVPVIVSEHCHLPQIQTWQAGMVAAPGMVMRCFSSTSTTV